MRFWEALIPLLACLIYWILSLIRPGALPSLIWKQNDQSLPRQMALYDQFILFGDSLFQHSSSQERGFTLAPALQAEYIRRLDVLNRGFSGFNTNQALKILPRVIPSPDYARVRFLVIFLGANDACLKGAAGSQHVPLTTYKQNLKLIIRHPSVVKQKPRIILITPPPINEYVCEDNDRLKGFFDRRRSANHTALYAQAARDVASEENVALIDLFSVFMQHAGQGTSGGPLQGSKDLPPNAFIRMLLHDGLHFTNLAYSILFQELMKLIGRVWPDQTPEKLPFVVPMWNDEKAWPREENGLAE